MSDSPTTSTAWFIKHHQRVFDLVGAPSNTPDAMLFRDEAARRIVQNLSGERDEPEHGGRYMGEARFIDELYGFAVNADIEPGPAPIAILRRIWDCSRGFALGFAQWHSYRNPNLREASPALEIQTLRGEPIPEEWQARWIMLGGRVYDGRMIAPKGHRLWVDFSEVGVPWMPFLEFVAITSNVRWREAESLGIERIDGEEISGWWAE